MTELEFPPGSGRRARYTAEERAMLRSIMTTAKAEGRGALGELEVLHDLKVEFGLDLVEDVIDENEPS